jgi:hypothetical protein
MASIASWKCRRSNHLERDGGACVGEGVDKRTETVLDVPRHRRVVRAGSTPQKAGISLLFLFGDMIPLDTAVEGPACGVVKTKLEPQ